MTAEITEHNGEPSRQREQGRRITVHRAISWRLDAKLGTHRKAGMAVISLLLWANSRVKTAVADCHHAKAVVLDLEKPIVAADRRI
jgi:hypothetical protein